MSKALLISLRDTLYTLHASVFKDCTHLRLPTSPGWWRCRFDVVWWHQGLGRCVVAANPRLACLVEDVYETNIKRWIQTLNTHKIKFTDFQRRLTSPSFSYVWTLILVLRWISFHEHVLTVKNILELNILT